MLNLHLFTKNHCRVSNLQSTLIIIFKNTSMTLFALLLFALPSIASGFVVPNKKCSIRPNHATNSPLFAEISVGDVLSATMKTSRLTYSFAELRGDVRKNPESYVDAADILTAGDDGMYTEDEIVAFVRKNEDTIKNDDSTINDLLLILNDGLPGDTRVRSFDDKDKDDELVYGIGVNRYVSIPFDAII